MTSSDKEFAAATIQAIGRCASNIAEVTDSCLNGLVLLMSNRDGGSTCRYCTNLKKSDTHKGPGSIRPIFGLKILENFKLFIV